MKTKKNNNKLAFGKIFTIILSVVVVCLMVTLADLFSRLITVGGFTFTSEDIYFPKYCIYAVCTSSHQTKVQAEENANTCKTQGGAGYIYLTNNNFYVIASMYESEEDAKKVKENLKERKPNIEIVKISISEISINNNLNSQEKDTLSKSITLFKNTYKELYDVSVSLDTSIITEVNARLSINSIGSDISKTQSNFNTLFSYNVTSNLLALKLKLESLNQTLKALIDSSGIYSLSSKIKETYCRVIFEYMELAEELR